MQSEIRELFQDAVKAVEEIQQFTDQISLDAYISDRMRKLAVERCFEVVGEILIRIRRENPSHLTEITDWKKIIAFRNILAHGYDQISDQVVWGGVITQDLPRLRQELLAALG